MVSSVAKMWTLPTAQNSNLMFQWASGRRATLPPTPSRPPRWSHRWARSACWSREFCTVRCPCCSTFRAILSSRLLKERLNLLGKIGCAICILGSTTIVIHSPKEEEVSSMEDLALKMKDAGEFYI